MIEMSVENVRINTKTQKRVLILKTLNQDRYLFIWIMSPEAYAIAAHLRGTISPRPLTHDVLKKVIEVLGGKVMRVEILDYVDEIYYARIILDDAGQEREIDARPSDAIALAIRVNAPVFAAEKVLERCGVTSDSRWQDEAPVPATEDEGQRRTEEDKDSS